MLDSFFAVTLSGSNDVSLYQVFADDGTSRHHPYGKKISLRGESSVRPGQKFGNRSMLAICKHLIFFTPNGGSGTKERKIEGVSTKYWGASTSPIIALFLKEEDAVRCFDSQDFVPYDPRWRDSTQEVLRSVEEDHPTFVVSHYPSLSLESSTFEDYRKLSV